MKIRTLLTAGAAAAVATTAAIAAPTMASAANGPAPVISVTQPAAPTSFANSLGTVSTGKVSGVVPARGTSLKKNAPSSAGTSRAAAACTEPDCNLPYGGGPVQHTPHVYIIFWGSKWGSDTTTQNFVKSFFTDLGQSTDFWSTTVEQYKDKTGHATFGKPLLAATPWVDTSAVPSSVTGANLAAEAAKAVSHWNITDTEDADVVIAAQQGTCFAPIPTTTSTFAGNCGTPQTNPSDYCAFHDWDVNSANTSQYLPWVNLPYQPDAGAGCGQGFINTPGTNDGYSITGGHEAMEVITDPIGTGYVDNADNISGGEVADKCAWGGQAWGQNPPDPAENLTFGGGMFAMQSLWSNAVSKCVINGGLPLTVTTPATQNVTLGKAVSLQIQASIGGAHTPLTYTASGLPAGLSINRSTGLISGTPGVTAGTFTSHVTVAYYAGWHTISFGWNVSSVAGQVKGYATKCVDDTASRTTAGNKIQIWTCNTGSAQKITFAANNELQVLGKCITSVSNRTVLESCTGTTSQKWTRLSNGEYVLKANGACLTEPSTNNGTQLTLTACRNIAIQHWTLP